MANVDLEVAFHLADAADSVTLRWWNPTGVASKAKLDGSPVTEADIAAEEAVLEAARESCPGDGFLGEEVGERPGTTGRRWIVDGIDGTRFFAAGAPTWGTLIALEWDARLSSACPPALPKTEDGGPHVVKVHSQVGRVVVPARPGFTWHRGGIPVRTESSLFPPTARSPRTSSRRLARGGWATS